ncbi:MAG: hypothetical protein Q9161_003117 [Pseudevernia consocians]
MSSTNTVSGGCLCGAVRYNIDFGGPDGWPPKAGHPSSLNEFLSTHTCQCTQCRKRSGALIAPWIDTAPSRITWSSPSPSSLSSLSPPSPSPNPNSPTTLPSFSEYSASPGKHRGFCTTCGSPLTWRDDEYPDVLEVTTGSVDGEVLAGEMGEWLGRASGGHYWCEAMIGGVTDLQGGKRLRGGDGSEEVGNEDGNGNGGRG